MNPARHRHDLSDHHGSLRQSRLRARQGVRGGVAHDKRRFINCGAGDCAHRPAVARRGATGPPITGIAQTPTGACAFGATRAWGRNGLRSSLDEPDCEWLMIDATHFHPLQGSQGSSTRNRHPCWPSGEGADKRKKGVNTKAHLPGDAHGMPRRALVTA